MLDTPAYQLNRICYPDTAPQARYLPEKRPPVCSPFSQYAPAPSRVDTWSESRWCSPCTQPRRRIQPRSPMSWRDGLTPFPDVCFGTDPTEPLDARPNIVQPPWTLVRQRQAGSSCTSMVDMASRQAGPPTSLRRSQSERVPGRHSGNTSTGANTLRSARLVFRRPDFHASPGSVRMRRWLSCRGLGRCRAGINTFAARRDFH